MQVETIPKWLKTLIQERFPGLYGRGAIDLATLVLNEMIRLELFSRGLIDEEPPKRLTWAEYEKRYWTNLVYETQGNIQAMRHISKVARSTIYRKLDYYELETLLQEQKGGK